MSAIVQVEDSAGRKSETKFLNNMSSTKSGVVDSTKEKIMAWAMIVNEEPSKNYYRACLLLCSCNDDNDTIMLSVDLAPL